VRPLSEILRDTIAVTEEQLDAARTLNVSLLDETTGLRQELLSELEGALSAHQSLAGDEQELVYELSELDARLERILVAGVSTLEALRGGGGAPVYNHEGRLSRSTT
jgi:hypothetical protein